uniref:VPS37D subunit of ESCRT-I n=1 Tax=Lepisosteus oculatus TaxID=7918 RepID=W5M2Z6_LEPOC
MSRGTREQNSNPDGFLVLGTSELRDLLDDEDKMHQIVNLDEIFQELQVDRETMLTTNRSLAEESLSRQPGLQNGKLQLADKYRKLEHLATVCQEKQRRLEAYIQKRSPQVARTLLQEEVSRAEEESEDLLEKFMEGSLPLEGFLDSFQSIRKICHIRRAQAEKIQELLKPNQNLRKPKNSGEEKKTAQQEPPSNGFSAQGPPRVFQLRYGLTPAILLPHFPLPSTSAIAHAASLPPLDSQPGQTQALGPSAPHSIPGQPVGLRVIGQLPGWPARPVRLQQICRQHNHHQPEPPYR